MNLNFGHLAAYFRQRFPVINMALFAILFLTVYSVARYFYLPAGTRLSWSEAGGILATISFFFRLRVFDEVKDYVLDAINHPHRVLQSGKVTLPQLYTLAALGTLAELAWSVQMGIFTVLCWLLALGYSLLMRYEFFVSGYLQKRLVLYAFTHMLIMPLLMLWLWSAYVPALSAFSQPYFLLALLGLLGGFSFEIARKIYPPGSERPLVDSYSKAIGYGGAIGTVLLLLLAGILVQGYLLYSLSAGTWPYILLAVLFGGTGFVYLKAWQLPHEKMLKCAEVLVSMFMLISYMSVIIEVNW